MSDILSRALEEQAVEYSVYARADENNKVSYIFSNCFEEPLPTDILIKSGYGDEFIHVAYFNIVTDEGAHRYKIENGTMVECTEEEIAAELAAMKIREVYAADLNELESISGGKLPAAGMGYHRMDPTGTYRRLLQRCGLYGVLLRLQQRSGVRKVHR